MMLRPPQNPRVGGSESQAYDSGGGGHQAAKASVFGVSRVGLCCPEAKDRCCHGAMGRHFKASSYSVLNHEHAATAPCVARPTLQRL